ncbi:MAG: hypothetical protein RLY58_2244 [Pseudomonadota bacterium]|jgi:hypothetical protein
MTDTKNASEWDSTDYVLSLAIGLMIGLFFGAYGKETHILKNCQEISLIVLDSKAFECKAAKP